LGDRFVLGAVRQRHSTGYDGAERLPVPLDRRPRRPQRSALVSRQHRTLRNDPRNWRFWTQSDPHRLLGIITWGRASYGRSEWGMSILLPYWLLACGAAAAGTGVLMMSRLLHRRSRRRAGKCVRCGYDLRATPQEGGALLDRCPECGAIPRPPHNLPMQRSEPADKLLVVPEPARRGLGH